ncbi:hypothetical protein ACFV5N_05975 [Streptomyces sp. NPDC059853]|uniref:hypothetical protein n=1 Tax=Streptomyces sp. NPDC059853 TaxID=3346973 RepID=UPI00364A694A
MTIDESGRTLSQPAAGSTRRLPLVLGLALVLATGTAVGVAANDRGSGAADPGGAAGPALRLLHEGRPAAVAASGLAEGLRLPLEDYLLSYQDVVAESAARREIERSCLAERGLAWVTPELFVHSGLPYNSMNTPRRYGITDLEAARSHGYDLPVPDGEPAAAPRSDVEFTVMYGIDAENAAVRDIDGIEVPDGGCVGESARVVGELDETLANELAGQAILAAAEHPDVITALDDWSVCMGEQGYDVDHPYRAPEVVTGSTPQEVAVTDIGCKERTGLVSVWFSVESEIQERLIEENHPELERERERNVSVLTAAEAIR